MSYLVLQKFPTYLNTCSEREVQDTGPHVKGTDRDKWR
jgi:hypothetical protein